MTTLNVILFPGSSNIRVVAHNGTDMHATMKGGNYKYLGVPLDVFEGFRNAESAGKYLNSAIKGVYEYERLSEAESLELIEAAEAELRKQQAELQAEEAVAGSAAPDSSAFQSPPGFVAAGTTPVKLLDPNVTIKYANPGDAAFDLMACSVKDPVTNAVAFEWAWGGSFFVHPGQHFLIGTGIAMALDPNHAGLVLSRSGLAKKHQIAVVNAPGLIDSGYTGEIGVLLENRGTEPFEIKQYDRIAQFMVVPIVRPTFVVVHDLQQTERGSGGFGSTGTEKL